MNINKVQFNAFVTFLKNVEVNSEIADTFQAENSPGTNTVFVTFKSKPKGADDWTQRVRLTIRGDGTIRRVRKENLEPVTY